MILLHAMGGLLGGGSTYLCFGIGGMLADVNLENGGLPWLAWSDWLVTAPLSRDLQTGYITSWPLISLMMLMSSNGNDGILLGHWLLSWLERCMVWLLV